MELLLNQSPRRQRKLLFFFKANDLIQCDLDLISHRRLRDFIWNSLFKNFYCIEKINFGYMNYQFNLSYLFN